MFLALTQDVPLDHVVPLAQYNHRVSIANTGTFALLSNICPHQNGLYGWVLYIVVMFNVLYV